MTFLEAAIEILRHAQGSLHFTEVARRAVEQNLLSHVGRDPEAAMRSCLNTAARGADSLLVRDKSGYYGIRAGARLPDPPPRPEPPQKSSDSKSLDRESKVKSNVRTSKKSSKAVRTKVGGRTRSTEEPEQGGRRRRADAEAETEGEEGADDDLEAAPRAEVRTVEFEAPSGSGLEGVTDVALVMANAMSRLVGERPELREELDAIQQSSDSYAGDREAGSSNGAAPRAMRDRAGSANGAASNGTEERSSRRRRRRRRRGKRVDWSTGQGGGRSEAAAVHNKLLDGVESVLEESGPRSLHVRQIAETLANRGLLGGEISEIERAVTSALLLDLHMFGRASRFVARGDARYQLQGTRLPEAAARAERELRTAITTLERETESQILQWLQSLGSRSLESLVRIYLQREGYALLSALPPARGVGRLIVEDPDPEEDARLLALVIPRRTPVDPKLWEGELERNGCSNILLVAMGDIPEEVGELRILGPLELAAWLKSQSFGVQTVRFEVPVLDMTIIESIGGLDT